MPSTSGNGRGSPFVFGDMLVRYANHATPIARPETAELAIPYQIPDGPHRHAPALGHFLDSERALLGRFLFQKPQTVGKQAQSVLGALNTRCLSEWLTA